MSLASNRHLDDQHLEQVAGAQQAPHGLGSSCSTNAGVACSGIFCHSCRCIHQDNTVVSCGEFF